MALPERVRYLHWSSLPLYIFTWCLVLSLLRGPGHLAAGEMDYINMEDFLAKQHQAASQGEWKVRKQWGLTDTTATLSKLFRYHIPVDAFVGNIDHFEVKKATGDGLPKWLHFNDDAATIEGLPTAQDIGQLYVTVIAIGKPLPSGEPNLDEDIFYIDVLPAGRESDKTHLRNDIGSSVPSHCDSTAEVTMLTITLDGDLNAMDATNRVRLVNRTMDYFKLSKHQLRLIPVENDEELVDGSSILTGRGNVLNKHSSGLHLQWPVGCGHQDSSAYESVVYTLEKSSSDGMLADILGLPVIGWRLATVKSFSSRQKRQQSTFENHTVTDSATTWDPQILENLPKIPILAIEKTGEHLADKESPMPKGRILPTWTYSTLNSATTSSFLSENPSLTTMLTNQDFAGIPILSTFIQSLVLPHVDPTSLEQELSTEQFLRSSMVEPSVSHTETVSLPDVASYQPTDAATMTVDTSIIQTISTTQLPQSLHPSTRTPDYKLDFVAGHISRFSLPPDVGRAMDAWPVTLVLINANGTVLSDNTWIQVDSSKREIYALPLATDVGKWSFVLRVMDVFSHNVSSQHIIEIAVHEDPRSPSVHHEFVMLVKYDMHRYRFAIDWQTRLITKLVTFFTDQDESSILVRSVATDPVVFTWTNTSLPTSPCPRADIDQLLDRMAYKGEGISTLPLRKVMSPDFRVSKVMVNLVGSCELEPGPNLKAANENRKPQVRNHIDRINATQGRMLRFVVPADTFFDEEDGGTRNLSLRFLTINGVDVAETSWIQFLASLQEFHGLPMAGDVGSVQYQLVAANGRNVSVADAFIITVVKPAGSKPPSVEFSLRIDADFHAFDNRPNNKYYVLRKLARLYGDPDPRHITVRSVTSGSVVFIWTNSTLPSEPCPAASIGQLVRVMFSSNGSVSRQLLEAFSRSYPVIGAEVIPGGVCLADVTPTKVSVGPSSTVRTEHAHTEDDVYISTIVPAVVIAAMLLVAALVACVLYRNKRKGKVTADEDSPFISKGIPIIFTEELEDRPGPVRASKEEKALLPPPKYPLSTGSGASSPPAEPEHESSSEVGSVPDEEEAENSPRYQPPPPLTSALDTSVNRPKHAPSYCLPPSYVPP